MLLQVKAGCLQVLAALRCRSMKPRLKEVAARAGVSEATVSRVVNGRAGVATGTRRDVLKALEELGYQPVGITPSPWTGTVGLIVPELENPVFPAFAQAIERRLAGHGATTVLCTATLEGTQEADYITMLLEREISGIIVVSGLHADVTADHGMYRRLADSDVPLVLVNGVIEDLDVPYVSADEAVAGELAVRHLADLGHTRIGMACGPLRYQPTQRRLVGFRRGLGGTGLPDDPELVVESLYSVEGGQAAATRLLELGVTAIVAGSDLMALGAVRAARERGLEVPGDVSVVGYDDTALIAFTDPPLTTLRQPVLAMGGAAAAAMSQLISGSGPGHRGEYLFRPELVVRRSSGPCRSRLAVQP